jgi:phosphatidate phosphatase PAH1
MSVKGLDSFFDVLEVLKTPEVFEQRAKELQEETRKYEEAIQSITKLQSVNDFIKEINLNKQNAKEVLETAHSSAIVIRDAAEKYSREQTQSIREQQRTL